MVNQAALVLTQIPDVTPALMRLAIRTFANIDTFLAAAPEDCPPPLRSVHAAYHSRPVAFHDAAARLAERLAAEGIETLVLGEPDYPRLLAEIHRPPALLFVRGNLSALSLPQLAIVGSRRASGGGLHNARTFAGELAAHGFAITSGLALGVDGAAHKGALERGKTIAVLGTGLDICYPHQHRNLARSILECGGVLVSEFPLGMGPRRENFPQRNRIISGLCLGILVVEAARESGSLITARLAMEQGREVFALPGSLHNPQARGCHWLIREGATLVESVADIVEHLGGMLAYKEEEAAAEAPSAAEGDEGRLLSAMGFDPVSPDTLVERTGLAISHVASMLVALELRGVVESVAGRYMRLR